MVWGWILIKMAIENEKGGYVKMSVSSIQQAHSAMLGHALRGQSRSKTSSFKPSFFCVNIIIRFLVLWPISKAKLDETSSGIQISPSPCSPRGIVPEKYFPMPKCETIPIDEPGSSFCGPLGFASRLQ